MSDSKRELLLSLARVRPGGVPRLFVIDGSGAPLAVPGDVSVQSEIAHSEPHFETVLIAILLFGHQTIIKYED